VKKVQKRGHRAGVPERGAGGKAGKDHRSKKIQRSLGGTGKARSGGKGEPQKDFLKKKLTRNTLGVPEGTHDKTAVSVPETNQLSFIEGVLPCRSQGRGRPKGLRKNLEKGNLPIKIRSEENG